MKNVTRNLVAAVLAPGAMLVALGLAGLTPSARGQSTSPEPAPAEKAAVGFGDRQTATVRLATGPAG